MTTGRACDGCTLCCKLLSVPALDKPRNVWCPHCTPGTGCGIHPTRPQECRDFFCQFLVSPALGEHWRPVVSKMVVATGRDTRHVLIHVDPVRQNAWRQRPYIDEIRQWAARAATGGGQVVVWQQGAATVVFPTGEKALGVVTLGQTIVVTTTHTPRGPVYDAALQQDG